MVGAGRVVRAVARHRLAVGIARERPDLAPGAAPPPRAGRPARWRLPLGLALLALMLAAVWRQAFDPDDARRASLGALLVGLGLLHLMMRRHVRRASLAVGALGVGLELLHRVRAPPTWRTGARATGAARCPARRSASPSSPASPTGANGYAGSVFVLDAHERAGLRRCDCRDSRLSAGAWGARAPRSAWGCWWSRASPGRRWVWSWWRWRSGCGRVRFPTGASSWRAGRGSGAPPWLARRGAVHGAAELRSMFTPVRRGGERTVHTARVRARTAAHLLRDPMALLRTLASLAVLWAGLELTWRRCQHQSRPLPDLTGPMRPVGHRWLTALLPVTGFHSSSGAARRTCGPRRRWCARSRRSRSRSPRCWRPCAPTAGDRSTATAAAVVTVYDLGACADCWWRATWCRVTSAGAALAGRRGRRQLIAASPPEELRGAKARPRRQRPDAAAAVRGLGRGDGAGVAVAHGRGLLRAAISTLARVHRPAQRAPVFTGQRAVAQARGEQRPSAGDGAASRIRAPRVCDWARWLTPLVAESRQRHSRLGVVAPGSRPLGPGALAVARPVRRWPGGPSGAMIASAAAGEQRSGVTWRRWDRAEGLPPNQRVPMR